MPPSAQPSGVCALHVHYSSRIDRLATSANQLIHPGEIPFSLNLNTQQRNWVPAHQTASQTAIFAKFEALLGCLIQRS
jgi:hypothetical protein